MARTGAAAPDDVVIIVDVDRAQAITSTRQKVNVFVSYWRVVVTRDLRVIYEQVARDVRAVESSLASRTFVGAVGLERGGARIRAVATVAASAGDDGDSEGERNNA